MTVTDPPSDALPTAAQPGPSPSAPPLRLDAVNRALEVDQIDRAVTLADEALRAGVEHPLFLNLVAFELERRGRFGDAGALLQRALELSPDDVLILTALGRVYSQLGRGPDALVFFERALAINPGHAPALHERGLARALQDDLDGARIDHQRAAALDPHYPGPLAALADLALHQGDRDAARDLASRALALDPAEPAAALVMAHLATLDGDHAGAAARVEGLMNGPLAPLHRATAEQLRGEALERLGRHAEGFAAIQRASAIRRGVYRPIYERPEVETGVALCQRLHDYFQAADPALWTAAPGPDLDNASGLVFLVGFVRSGTTLLEQVLASHPAVTALEEQATLRGITPEWFADNTGLDRLARIDEARAAALRADYWRRVRSFGVDPKDKVFVDKAPLSTIWLPMVAKLFPSAKVLLAIRDPRDVVISAFRHRFVVNGLTWAFTDLEDTARLYSGVMDLAALYQETCALSVYRHRHEDLVDDFDAEVGRICEFIGLPWTDSLRDFAETAKRRDVRTPSADQVRRGLFREGLGRWRRYGRAVDPILPILEPWVKRYGYEA